MFENKMSVFLTWVTLSTLVLLLFSVESGWSQKRERVTLKYTWVFNSNIAPVFMGLEKGFFAAEGIDLDWQDGRGSNKNLKLLSAKKLLMSFAGAGTAAKFISHSVGLKRLVLEHESKGRKPSTSSVKSTAASHALYPMLTVLLALFSDRKPQLLDLEKWQ